jgi:hypothetical protein
MLFILEGYIMPFHLINRFIEVISLTISNYIVIGSY